MAKLPKYDLLELPGFEKICGELEEALKDSMQQYVLRK